MPISAFNFLSNLQQAKKCGFVEHVVMDIDVIMDLGKLILRVNRVVNLRVKNIKPNIRILNRCFFLSNIKYFRFRLGSQWFEKVPFVLEKGNYLNCGLFLTWPFNLTFQCFIDLDKLSYFCSHIRISDCLPIHIL